jgi:hypothetical protein
MLGMGFLFGLTILGLVLSVLAALRSRSTPEGT